MRNALHISMLVLKSVVYVERNKVRTLAGQHHQLHQLHRRLIFENRND